jgi:MoxR-like ATPase
VSFPFFHNSGEGRAKVPLTVEQLRAARLIGSISRADRSVALFGEYGSGKAHLMQTVAQKNGATMSVIQFSPGTGNFSVTRVLGMEENANGVESVKQKVQPTAKLWAIITNRSRVYWER